MKNLLAVLLAFALLLPVLAGCQGASSTQLADPTETTISQESALGIVLTDAGLTQEEIKDLDIDLDRENGVLQYEVEFEKDNKDYDYVVLAETGEILFKEVPQVATPTTKPTEAAPTTKPVETKPTEATPTTKPAATQPTTKLTKDDALAIALDNAGVKKSQVYDLEAELDKENGVWRYEIDFEVGNYDYEYDIHAQTGEILYKEIPASTNTTTTKPTATEPADKLTQNEAISIALSHAGLKKSQVYDLEAELDKENGVWLYEVNFESGGYDYEYDIHAETGKILHTSKEQN